MPHPTIVSFTQHQYIKEIVKNTPDKNIQLTGDWGSQCKVLKGKYPLLTDQDLHWETSDGQEMMVKRVMGRLSRTHEEVVDMIWKVQMPNA